MNYNQEELINMIYALGAADENCLLASRLYASKYPDRRHPQVKCFTTLKDRFERTGSIHYEKKSRAKPILNEENQLDVSLAVVENPDLSVREISRNLNISKTSVSKSLKNNKFHPYHMQLHQELIEADFAKRVQFCEIMQTKIAENGNFLKYIMFTDECTFHKNGYVNRHNYHYYSTENLHKTFVNNYQHRWSLNVWGGIVNNYVVGPYFFNRKLTGQEFHRFLREDFPRLIEDLPDEVKNMMWFQLDGAPAHFMREVREELNLMFPNKWIGRTGPISWPPRSPDLTSMDFYLWGTIKSEVYRTAATTQDDMKLRIHEAFQRITPIHLNNVRSNLLRRFRKCVERDGRHFEQEML